MDLTRKSGTTSTSPNVCVKQFARHAGLSWSAISSFLTTAMLALFWIDMPLHAQSIHVLEFGFGDHDAQVSRQEECSQLFSLARLPFDIGLTLTQMEVEGVDRVKASIQYSGSNPLAAFIEVRKPCSDGTSFSYSDQREELDDSRQEKNNETEKNGSKSVPAKWRDSTVATLNRGFYYKNKLEFTLEGGWLPINVPFPFDFLLGDGYNFPGLYYTLVPFVASVRWQVNDVAGPWVLRGNWDVTAGVSATWIPRGAESRYLSYIMGIRRNFIPHRSRVAPYFEGGVGLGNIDAKGPLGVAYAQGQNFTFTLNLGSGVRYNLSSLYALEGGIHYMHISNLYLSEPKFLNYGINVYGPWAGINIRFGKPHSMQGNELTHSH